MPWRLHQAMRTFCKRATRCCWPRASDSLVVGHGRCRGLAQVAVAAAAYASLARCRRASTFTQSSAAGSASPALGLGDTRILAHAEVVPYGVLGSSSAGPVAPEPDAETAFVDPAGLHHIRGGPGGAGGAAGVIYRWLGIAGERSFPEPVKAAVTAPLLAKFHAYGASGEKKCIHVIGPDLRARHYTLAKATEELSEAYKNVFAEFYSSGLHRLRLLPVSGGIFSGPFGEQLPQITAEALAVGFSKLPEEQQQHLLDSHVEMCIFLEEKVEGFRQAFKAHLGAAKL